MRYLLASVIALGLAMPIPASFAATQSGQGVSTLSATGVELVAKKKAKKKKAGKKGKVAKK